MKDQEPKRRGPKEKPIPERELKELTTSDRMRLARQQAGKTLSETAEELQLTSRHLSYVERGRRKVTRRLARQYEELFEREPGEITGTIYNKLQKKEQGPEKQR